MSQKRYVSRLTTLFSKKAPINNTISFKTPIVLKITMKAEMI